MMKINKVWEVQWCKSKLVTRSMARRVQWRSNDEYWNKIKMRKNFNESSIF